MAAERIGRAIPSQCHGWPAASGCTSAHFRLSISWHNRCPVFKFLTLGCPCCCICTAACVWGWAGPFPPRGGFESGSFIFFVSFSFRGTVNRTERARQDDALAFAHIGASVCTATYGRGRAHLLETTTELTTPRRRQAALRGDSGGKLPPPPLVTWAGDPARPAALPI